MSTKSEKLLIIAQNLFEDARLLMEKKNADYRGGTDDPFANFRGSTSLGIDPIQGILIRLQDKLQRINSFVINGDLSVKDESLKDTLIDIINYAALIYAMEVMKDEV